MSVIRFPGVSSPDDDDDDEVEVAPSPQAPLEAARALIEDEFTHDGMTTIRYWKHGWWQWLGSYWEPADVEAIKRVGYEYYEHAHYKQKNEVKPWQPTDTKLNNLLKAAAAAICHLDSHMEQPFWIGKPQGDVIACRNGLLDLGTRELRPHTPAYFNPCAVPLDYDPKAPKPEAWLAFLKSLWGDDTEQPAALQEWCGYVLSNRLDLHKMLLLVGPPRSGKGTISRVLTNLIGSSHVAGPSCHHLGTSDFALADLIGKPLAIIPDARGAGNKPALTERLLNISGEDTVTCPIKQKPAWNGRLPSRIMICSNEVPEFKDPSGVIVSRFLLLTLTKSFLGKEDESLEPRLMAELGGIMNWALAGLDKLDGKKFTVPSATAQTMQAFADLVSPIAAFLNECTEVKPNGKLIIDDLYDTYGAWCDERGINRPEPDTARFGKSSRALYPHLERCKVGPTPKTQVYAYKPIAWTPKGKRLFDNVVSKRKEVKATS